MPRVDRLAEIVVHADVQHPLAIALKGRRGQGDDGEVPAPVGGANRGGGLQAIHHRHVQVHQHQVEGPRLEFVQGFAPMVGHLDAQAHLAQDRQRHLLVGGVVLHQQQFGTPHRGGAHVRADVGQSGCGQGVQGLARIGQLQRQGEPEGAALARAGLDADLPAHQLDQTLADGEPQARATKAPRGGLVGLAEGLKQSRDLLGAQADAGVAHRETQPPPVLVGRSGRFVGPLQRPHGQPHRAAVGELDRVADQVVQHLPQAQGIAAKGP